MNRRHALFAVLAILTASAVAMAVDKVPLPELLKSPKAYDGKTLSTTGIVSAFKQRTSRAGNKYFTFKLAASDKDKETVNVYSQGEAESGLKDGHKVAVIGVFREEKKVQDFTVKNEIDATKVKDKENGVKLLK